MNGSIITPTPPAGSANARLLDIVVRPSPLQTGQAPGCVNVGAPPFEQASGLLPVASSHERGPVERVRALAPGATFPQDRQARLVDGFGGVQVPRESTVIQRPHPCAGCLVLDRPQAHDDRAHAGSLKRAPQSEHTFAGPDLPQP